MHETSKAKGRRSRAGYFLKYLCGAGIDVGCGGDALEVEDGAVVPYDRKIDPSHDAGTLAGVADGSLDFLYSSNCLEHLPDPEAALRNWLRVVRPGGHILFTVPDEDLYEQGVWPSRWNRDHKWSFTTDLGSPMPRSIHLPTWLGRFPAEVVSVAIADAGYDRSLRGVDQTMRGAEAFIEVILWKRADQPGR